MFRRSALLIMLAPQPMARKPGGRDAVAGWQAGVWPDQGGYTPNVMALGKLPEIAFVLLDGKLEGTPSTPRI
jgi:hypothetical protein